MKKLIILLAALVFTLSTASAFTEISGEIESTTWDIIGSPYVLTENVIIPDGNHLVIEPGVEVLAHLMVTFIVEGSISAQGVEGDSIIFTGYTELPWDGFELWYVDKPCYFEYCRFEMGTTGNGRQNGGVIYTRDSEVHIEHSLFFDNHSNHNCAGLYSIYSSVFLEHCIFAYNESDNSGIVGGDLGGSIEISYCLFHHNTAGVGAVLTTYPHEYTVDHCTFADNISLNPYYGSIFYNHPAVYWEFTNSIIVSDQEIEYGNSYSANNVEANYCCLSENQLSGGNQIYEDPMFVDPDNGDYHLLAGSPCINAGDPDYPYDWDGTITDLGCYPNTDVSVDETVLPADIQLAQAWPNPFNSSTNVKITLVKPEQVDVSIYDILGRKINTLAKGNISAGEHSYNWDASTQSAGTYFVSVQTAEHTEILKLLLLK